jgi:hypothetical protein
MMTYALTPDDSERWSLSRYVDHSGRAFFRVLPTATVDCTSYETLVRDRTRKVCRECLAAIVALADNGKVRDWDTDSATLEPQRYVTTSRHVTVLETSLERAIERDGRALLRDISDSIDRLTGRA